MLCESPECVCHCVGEFISPQTLLSRNTFNYCDLLLALLGDTFWYFFLFNFCISHRSLLSSAQRLLLGPQCSPQCGKCVWSQGYIVPLGGPQLSWRLCDSRQVWPPVSHLVLLRANLETSCLGFLTSRGPPGGWMWTIHLVRCLCKSWPLPKIQSLNENTDFWKTCYTPFSSAQYFLWWISLRCFHRVGTGSGHYVSGTACQTCNMIFCPYFMH